MPRRPHRARPVTIAMATAAFAAALWFVHLSVSYALVPAACRRQGVLLLAVVTAIGVAIGACCTGVAARHQGLGVRDRGSRTGLRSELELGEPSHARTDGTGTRRTAVSGLALAAYFTFVILLAALIPIIVDPCA